MVAVELSAPTIEAAQIPYVSAGEAYARMQVELERLLALLETLAPADWTRPTACTLWDVRQMVAHQAGGYASGTSLREMLRQYAAIPRPGQLIEDVINRRQVGERLGCTPAELIAELRRSGPVAIRNWAYGFRLIKPVTVPHPVGGMLSVRHLMWVIHSRDTWMHRLDICRAAGKPFEMTPAHDGRIVALIVKDVAARLDRRLSGRAIALELGGPAGGSWIIGRGEPLARLQADALDFSIFASGRYSFDEFRPRLTVSGDVQAAEAALANLIILF